jgi:hypothetical protein
VKKSIVIFAHSRAQLLDSCISSVLSAYKSSEWKKVIVFQIGFLDVEDIVKKYENKFDLVLRIKKQYEVTLGNINHNRLLGTSICFDILLSDVVLGIEEDTRIGYDSLVFIEQMCELYGKKRSFRGVNLGSFEPNTEDNRYTYSLLRFGLHGQAGALTRKTWNAFSLKNLLEDICHIGWDSRIESYLKTGFLATPNASRFLDQGWGGTHQSNDPDSPYFFNQRQSWVGTLKFPIRVFTRKNLIHSWRKDARNYRFYESFLYKIKNTKSIFRLIENMRSSLRNIDELHSFIVWLKRSRK